MVYELMVLNYPPTNTLNNFKGIVLVFWPAETSTNVLF